MKSGLYWCRHIIHKDVFVVSYVSDKNELWMIGGSRPVDFNTERYELLDPIPEWKEK